MAKASSLTVELAKQFAWLLRNDIRNAYPSRDDPGFNEWWLIKGRQEFPGWIDSIDPQTLEHLFLPNDRALIAGINFEVPKIVSLLAKYRQDAVKEFSKDGELDKARFLAWVVIRGLNEHKLIKYVPFWFISVLDQVLPETIPAANSPSNPPGVTFLMYLVWILMDEITQDSNNLFTSEGRSSFLPWFFSVVKPLGLTSLVSGRWKAWLLMPIEIEKNGLEIPRFSQIAWMHSAELRSKITIKSPAEYLKLKEWSEIALQKSPWDWLIKGSLFSNQNHLLPSEPLRAKNQQKPFGLNLYGFAYGELGIGEDLRMAVECCKTAGIPYHVINVDAGNTGQADMFLKGEAEELAESQHPPPFNTNLFCLPAFDTVSRIFMQKGASVFEGFRNIGWWPWELAVFPKAWTPYAFELVDEVWASSKFLFDMYKRYTHKPVKLVPLAVSVARIKSYPRKHYGLPEKKFLFLYIFDFNSSFARKNPMAAVRAFKLAFKEEDNKVGLVLKTMNVKSSDPEWLALLKECQTDKRIKLITETLERPQVLGLIKACDAYVSLHRSEGFGRTLAEAILLDKPVIATNYSGNVDFMIRNKQTLIDFKLIEVGKKNYQWIESVDQAVWADPIINDAADKLTSISKGMFYKYSQDEKEKFFSVNSISVEMKNILL